tara:strand:+ start:294 stop:1061 length:768 start_codon:yes stop_codon:yes gene_type:complete
MGCVHTNALTPDVLVLQHLEKTATLLPIDFSLGTQVYVDNCNVAWKICSTGFTDTAQTIQANNTLIMSLPTCPYILAPFAAELLSTTVVCTCMPFAGPDLFEWLQTPFSWNQAVGYLVDIAKGIRWLHQHNIGHSDVKPENVVIGTDNAQLIDFDFSAPFEDWKYCGTKYYMPPPTIVKRWHKQSIAKRMDVYAYGKTILAVLFFYSVHTSQKTAKWLYEPYITESSKHQYTGKQEKWANLAFKYCRKVPPTTIE